MAAVGYNVSRRRGYASLLPESDYGRGTDGCLSEESSRLHNRRIKTSRYGEATSDCRTKARELDAVPSVSRIQSRNKDPENSGYEDGQAFPLEKKRKFSPIIWDRRENEVRVVKIHPTTPRSFEHGLNVGLDGNNLKKHASVNQLCELEPSVGMDVSKPPTNLLPQSVPLNHIVDDDLEGQLEDEDELIHTGIAVSRWASKIDSLMDLCTCDDENAITGNEAVNSNSSENVSAHSSLSSESCLFLRDGSEESLTKSPGSEDGCTVRHDTEDECDYLHVEQSPIPTRKNINMMRDCRSIFEYEKLNKINEGIYGIVFRARDKKTGEIVALKKVKMAREEEGFPLSSLREINILLSFDHPSVVGVKEVVMGDLDSVFLVMEYMEHDLKGLMEVIKQPLSISEVKCLMLQLLHGVNYLHCNWVLHRDLKTSNILLNNKGELKICDFGMSRQYGSSQKPHTPLVVTLWYRAPELLLGAKAYTTAIDMWSVGCIMAELLNKVPLFTGKTEFDQLDQIFKVLGTPNEMIWPGYSALPRVKVNFVKQPYNILRNKFSATSFTGAPTLSNAGFDLLSQLLTYDPKKRISAEDALQHKWFQEVPLAKSRDFMPTFPPLNARNRYAKR